MSDIVYENFAFSTPFLQGYQKLKIPIADAAGNPAWPEKFPPAAIAQLREVVGPRHFAAQMMLEYIAPDRARLDPDALDIYDAEFDLRTAKIDGASMTGAAIYWDPSSGRKKSDGSVCVMIYRDDKNRHIYIHDVLYLVVGDEELHPLARQCEMVLEFMARHHMRRITIETNGIGNALPEIMRDVAMRRGASVVVNKIANHANKADRILNAIEPVLTTGRLHAHRRVTQTPLIAEMIGWMPVGATTHDDGLDAVAGAICAEFTAVHACGFISRPIQANTKFKL